MNAAEIKDITEKVIESVKLLYPSHTSKKEFINRKRQVGIICSSFVLTDLFNDKVPLASIVRFCDNKIPRITTLHALIHAYGGNEEFKHIAPEMVNREKTALEMTRQMEEDGRKKHSDVLLNRLVYDIIKQNPVDIFPSFRNAFATRQYGEKEYARDSLIKFMSSHPGLDVFRDRFEETWDNRKWVDKWASTPFKRKLMEKIKEWVDTRTQTTSSNPGVIANATLCRYINTLRCVDRYVNERHPEHPPEIDALQWYFSICTRDMANRALIHCVENYCTVNNDIVRSKQSPHHGTEFVYAFVSLVKNIVIEYCTNKGDMASLNAQYILSLSRNKREQAPPDTRRHFLPSEIINLRDHIMENKSPLWKLMITILIEVSLRATALSNLKVGHFISTSGYTQSVTINEKNNRTREFVVSDSIKEMLDEYFSKYPLAKKDMNRFMFRSQEGEIGRISHQYSPSHLNKVIKGFAEEIGIIGKHVHLHAFRHTLVNTLMAQGNKLESVSKFIGHKNTTTTEQYYWTADVSSIIKTMNIPWIKKTYAMPSSIEDDEPELENRFDDEALSSFADDGECAKCDLISNILLTYHSIITDEQKQVIKAKIPNIEEIFKEICESTIASSISEC
jgi:integrase